MPGTTTTTINGLTAARYGLTIDGVEIGQFTDLIGITSEIAAVGPDQEPLKPPRRPAPPTVTLKRGQTKDMGFVAWHQSVVEGQIATARKSHAHDVQR